MRGGGVFKLHYRIFIFRNVINYNLSFKFLFKVEQYMFYFILNNWKKWHGKSVIFFLPLPCWKGHIFLFFHSYLNCFILFFSVHWTKEKKTYNHNYYYCQNIKFSLGVKVTPVVYANPRFYFYDPFRTIANATKVG